MNNVTYLSTIYEDHEARAVFDGSIQGMKEALAKIHPTKSFSDLHDISIGESMMGEETGEYLEDMGAYWGEYTAPDEFGVYLRSADLGLAPKQQEIDLGQSPAQAILEKLYQTGESTKPEFRNIHEEMEAMYRGVPF